MPLNATIFFMAFQQTLLNPQRQCFKFIPKPLNLWKWHPTIVAFMSQIRWYNASSNQLFPGFMFYSYMQDSSNLITPI